MELKDSDVHIKCNGYAFVLNVISLGWVAEEGQATFIEMGIGCEALS